MISNFSICRDVFTSHLLLWGQKASTCGERIKLKLYNISPLLQPFTEGQKAMSRAIVAVELLKLNKNGIFDFKDATTTVEVVKI